MQTEKTEIRKMYVSSSIQYQEGKQIELADLTHGKEPFFYSIRIGDLSIHVDKNQVAEFKRELTEILNRMSE